MKVYVVIDKFGLDYDNDQTEIIGVYSTKEKAINKIKEELGDNIKLIDEESDIYHYEGPYDYHFMTFYEKELDN